ncbi:MAG: glycosyltransferase family 4 protein [Pyrobaculum sp.]
MKIAVIRREFITHLDGVNKFVANLAEGLKQLGQDVVIVSWSHRGVRREELTDWFRQVHGLDAPIEVYTLRGPEEKDKWATMLYEWWRKGGKLLKELGVEASIVNGVVPLGLRPKVAVAHGPIAPNLAERLVLRALYATYDRVVCVSKATIEYFRGITKCDEIVPLPLKLKNYTPRPLDKREDIVVHIGTSPRKNPQISAEAVKMLRERGRQVKLVLIGGRSEIAEELAKRPYVEAAFGIDEKAKADLLSRAKALVLPSSAETFSYVALEAMASGTPPVVSAAVPDDVVIDGHNGFRIDGFDPAAYAEALERLLADDGLWREVSTNSLNFVKKLDHVEVARRYLLILESIWRS